MIFSTLEQKVIKDLCCWASTPNVFNSTRDFLSQKGLCKGTGLFSFSKEIENRPPTVLSVDIVAHQHGEYNNIYNQTLFVLYFLRKLERLGFVTISEGRYSSEKEYAIAVFTDASIIGIRNTSDETQWSYSFTYMRRGGEAIDAELIENALTIRRRDNEEALSYVSMELFSRFDTFDLISSNIALEQELFDLLDNGFRTSEELMLETANEQLNTAKRILENAQAQTAKAIESIEQEREQFETAQDNSKNQFEIAQTNAKEQFKEERNESIRQFKSASCKSTIALVLAVLSIIASPFVAKWVPSTIDSEQYQRIDSVQTETLKTLEEINTQVMEPDTALIGIANRLNTMSITLEKISKRSNVKTPRADKN